MTEHPLSCFLIADVDAVDVLSSTQKNVCRLGQPPTGLIGSRIFQWSYSCS